MAKTQYQMIQTACIKRIIRGMTSATVAGTSVTLTPAVVPENTIISCSSGRASNDTILLNMLGTIITVTSSVAGNVNWQVIEYGGTLADE